MSRSYRISVSESIRRHVKVDDGVQTRVEMLAILPPQRMADLLAAELEQLGFERDGNTVRRVDEDGTEVTVDLEQGTVTVHLAQEADVELSRQRTGSVYDRSQASAHEEALRRQLRSDMEKQVDREEEKMREQVTAKLEQKLRDIQQAIDQAVNRASASALKEKAAQLGEIEEVTEDAETGSLTIRVRV